MYVAGLKINFVCKEFLLRQKFVEAEVDAAVVSSLHCRKCTNKTREYFFSMDRN